MFVLGLLFLAAAAVAAVELVIANDTTVTFSMWNQDWRIESYWVAAIGAAIMLAAVLGLWMLRVSAARQRRIRRERKELAKENRMLTERVRKTPVTTATTAAAPAATTRDGVPANRPGYPPATDYPAAPAAAPVAEPVEERRGFFARHSVSGRHGHYSIDSGNRLGEIVIGLDGVPL